jgi:hypothetical protein
MPVEIIRDLAANQIHYKLPGALGRFSMPAIHESEAGTLPVLLFTGAVEELGTYGDKIPAIANDRDLSEIGRAKKLEPLQRDLVLRMANVDAQLDRDAAHFDKREAALLAVPKLENTYTAMAVEDVEARQWWREQPVEERAKLLKRIESEPGHERLMIALMRSPVPQLDLEVKFVADVWKRAKRLENPAEALAIDAGRQGVEWGRRGISQVAAITKRVLQWDDQRIVRTMLSSADPDHHRGLKVFGIDPMAAERVKRAIAAESRVRY